MVGLEAAQVTNLLAARRQEALASCSTKLKEAEDVPTDLRPNEAPGAGQEPLVADDRQSRARRFLTCGKLGEVPNSRV